MTNLSYTSLRARCDLLASRIMARANEEVRLAGLGSWGCHVHNAMIDYRAGRPWAKVDYRHLRRAVRISEQSFEPRNILERLYRRKGPRAFSWN